jgi:hypothetical protein
VSEGARAGFIGLLMWRGFSVLKELKNLGESPAAQAAAAS